METVNFKMEPFSCPSCIKKIEKVVGGRKGVIDLKVYFHSNKIKVRFEESVTSVNELKETLVKLGYPVLEEKVIV